ncbi:cell wall-binding repeat-containing protein [Herbiconiux sp. 11R-BC]|uniref:cell wall-binding repeat-containing protein n=1 Tax=Herbiconiux sp. 11R-BC TaxID=3111637 RepID=UPI003BFBCF55
MASVTIAGLALVASPAAHALDGPTSDQYDVRAGALFHVGAEAGVKSNDGAASATFQAATTVIPAHGTLTLAADGSFDYAPAAGFVGDDIFRYCLIAVAGTPCATGNISVVLSVKSTVERIGGADRFAVSAAASAGAFPAHVPVAYVASGAVFPDALSAGAAAGAQGAPVLLIEKDSVPAVVGTELSRLQPGKIVMLGGLNTLSAQVQTALSDYSGDVTRVGGADRYVVSAAVSRGVFAPMRPVVFIASGEVFPDALSGSAAVGIVGGPLLLVQKNSIPSDVAAEIARLTPLQIVVLGGKNTIADEVVTTLQRSANTIRIDGSDRFEVSASVSANTFAPADTHTVYVASGAGFPDALSGSAAAISKHAPVLLVTKDGIPAPVATELDRLKPTRIVVLGGENTVSAATEALLATHLAH